MKITLEMAGIDTLIQKLKTVESDIKPDCEDALHNAFNITTEKINSATPYRAHGGLHLRDALKKDFEPSWEGDVLSCPAGFDFSYPNAVVSVYLKNGTGGRYWKTRIQKNGMHRYTGALPKNTELANALNLENIQNDVNSAVQDILTDKIVEKLK